MRRKTLLLAIALLMAAISGAQVTQSGNFVLGSTVGFSTASSKITQRAPGGSQSEQSPYSTQLNIAPSVGYFLFDNFSLGMRVDYTAARVEEVNNNYTENSDVLLGPFFRYYQPVTPGKDMYLFAEAGFGFGNSRDVKRLSTGDQRINTNLFAFGVGPGITVVANNAIGLEAIVKYNFARSEFDTQIAGVEANTTTRTNQVSIALGLQFYFAGFKPANR
ncbi:MAG TPA: outer membrane beta-barrel protein [Saprospiraceae bacterium]|nr:outer membrane beta-barrel protein [Saprospiraceae bacterium]HMP23014.1 outer membrane beta-barrel protein [Saprospiraceae bacterium]